MTDDEKLEMLERFASARDRSDNSALMELMSEDCVCAASVGDGPGATYRGRDEVRRGFARVLKFAGKGAQRTGQVWFSDEYAFALWSYDDIGDKGEITEIKGIGVFRFVNGKLQLKDAYRKT